MRGLWMPHTGGFIRRRWSTFNTSQSGTDQRPSGDRSDWVQLTEKTNVLVYPRRLVRPDYLRTMPKKSAPAVSFSGTVRFRACLESS